MPRERIPIRYTNSFKARAVEDWWSARARGVTRVAFARSLGVPRQNWEHKYSRLAQASQCQLPASANLPNVGSRGYCLTLSGSGRKAATLSIEDALCVFIKDERRLGHTVTIDGIIEMATELLPDVMGSKIPDGKRSWCQRFMRRHSLTIRRICHSGLKTRDELEALRLPFLEQMTQVVTSHCYFDPNTSLTVARALFNMD